MILSLLSKALLVLQRPFDGSLQSTFLKMVERLNLLKWTFPVPPRTIPFLKQEDIITIPWHYWIYFCYLCQTFVTQGNDRSQIQKKKECAVWESGIKLNSAFIIQMYNSKSVLEGLLPWTAAFTHLRGAFTELEFTGRCWAAQRWMTIQTNEDAQWVMAGWWPGVVILGWHGRHLESSGDTEEKTKVTFLRVLVFPPPQSRKKVHIRLIKDWIALGNLSRVYVCLTCWDQSNIHLWQLRINKKMDVWMFPSVCRQFLVCLPCAFTLRRESSSLFRVPADFSFHQDPRESRPASTTAKKALLSLKHTRRSCSTPK